jgi:hypothetical protein
MEIEKLEHTVTNIWNVKQYRTKQNWNLPKIARTYSM